MGAGPGLLRDVMATWRFHTPTRAGSGPMSSVQCPVSSVQVDRASGLSGPGPGQVRGLPERCVPGSLTSTTACQGLLPNEPHAVMGGSGGLGGGNRAGDDGEPAVCIGLPIYRIILNPATQSGPRPCRVSNLDAKPMTPPSTGLAGGMQQIGQRSVKKAGLRDTSNKRGDIGRDGVPSINSGKSNADGESGTES